MHCLGMSIEMPCAVGVLDNYMATLDRDSVEESIVSWLFKRIGCCWRRRWGEDGGLEGIKKALIHLDEIHNMVVDHTGWWFSMRLSYQLQLGQFESAKETVFALLERGSTEEYQGSGVHVLHLHLIDNSDKFKTTRSQIIQKCHKWRSDSHSSLRNIMLL